MNIDAILIGAGMILTLLAAILMHEAGHILFFRAKFKRRVKFSIRFAGIGAKFLSGEIDDYKALTPEQYIQVNWWGIIAGIIPILIMTTMIGFYSLMVFPYLAGCIPDFKEIKKTSEAIGKPMWEFEDE